MTAVTFQTKLHTESQSYILKLIYGLIFILGGAAVTVALFLLMRNLIYQEEYLVEEGPARRIIDIIMEDVQIQTFRTEELPDKPDEVEEQPPEPEIPEIQPEKVTQDINLNIGSTRINIKVGKGFSSDGEYLPIVKVAPIYPRLAQTRGIEGYCIVEYVVTQTGAVRDPVIVDCPNSVFSRASLKAALKFKYKPRIVDGDPVEVSGVLNKFTYELEK